MPKDHLAVGVGYAYKTPNTPARKAPVILELVATVVLVVSTAIAATVVSIGIARADVPGAADADAPLAIALFVGLALVAMGGMTAMFAVQRRRRHY
jgi:hypothetical protein